MSLIVLEQIQKSYFSGTLETAVLHDISLEIKSGEFVSIMGPSGAGKSTLLHILGFLDQQTGGQYSFEGKKIDDYTEKERAKVRNERMGFVFQSFNLLARTSVLENVKLPLLYSQIPSKKWDSLSREAIESVGLSNRIDHDPSQLSGGEKQRVAIARALVCDPHVIFADEPTGNLDTKSGDNIMHILQALQKEGKTIVLITHEMEIARFSERTIHIVDGKVDKDRPIKNRIFKISNNFK
ncbi:ABC transporter ATP-binding protein [Candidatus Gracilibacteria bacterium]|nr:ABC transporter ATP-binding protein [Candidatus Gracilibacteria bacterium]